MERILTWFLISTYYAVSSWPYHFCGETHYSLEQKLCCGSKLYNNTRDGQKIQCCEASNKTYKVGSEVCCGDVYNKTKFEAGNFFCCNGVTTKKDEEICCGGVRIRLGGGTGCCGNTSFNVRNGICCKDHIHTRRRFHVHCCGNEIYNNRTHYCQERNSFDEVLPINIERCGNVLINQSTHTCCHEDSPVDITGYKGEFPPVCCNKTILPDRKTYHCYKDHILPINQWLCINKTENSILYSPFTLSTEWCCNGTIIPKNNTSGRSETCCGSNVIDQSTQGCCANKTPYANFKYCCGETVVDSKEKCCGTTELTKKQVCCNESGIIFPMKKRSKYHDGCCNGKSHRRVDDCPIVNERPPTCGRQVWDKTKDICCNNVLYKGKKRRDIECCGANIRDVTYQDCIFGRPKNKPICGRNNTRTKNYRFFKTAKRKGLRCCGADIIDRRTHKCCNNRPVPLNSVCHEEDN